MKTLLATSVATLALSSVASAENWDMPVAYPANNYHTEIAQICSAVSRVVRRQGHTAFGSNQ